MFRKKEPKYKQTNPDDPWIIKTWQTPRGRAALKLGIYGVFILLVLLLIFFRSDLSPKVYKTVYTPYKKDNSTKIEDLKKNNFAYKYTITINETKILYYGNKLLNIESGYKEDINGIIKYIKENDKVYKVGLTEKEEMTNLYENLNPNYFSVNYIMELIEPQFLENKDNEQNYILDNGVEISIKSDNSDIKNIIIKDGAALYELEYSNIGKVTQNDIEK